MSLLEGKLLSRSYGPVQALDRVSFTLEPGEILGVAGESGCGKSTLLRLISGLEPPDTGKLLLRGQALSARRSRDQLRAVQLIFQDAAGSFHPRRRIADSIQDSVRSLLGRDSRADIPALCALVGLDPALARRYPRELSGGQCQRFAIARAMAVEPEVLLCDEITSALDTVSQAPIAELLRSLCRRRRMAAVFVSHDLALVSGLCSHLLVMRQGRVVEEGPPDRLVSAPCHPYTRRLISSVLELQ